MRVADGPPKYTPPTGMVVEISSSDRSLRGAASHPDNQSGSFPRARRTCCLCGITSASHLTRSFTSNPRSRVLWIRALTKDEEEFKILARQLDDLNHPVLCESHFRKECFFETSNKRILRQGSVPNIIKQSDKVYSSQALLKHMTEKNVCDRPTRVQPSPSTDIYSPMKKPLDSPSSNQPVYVIRQRGSASTPGRPVAFVRVGRNPEMNRLGTEQSTSFTDEEHPKNTTPSEPVSVPKEEAVEEKEVGTLDEEPRRTRMSTRLQHRAEMHEEEMFSPTEDEGAEVKEEEMELCEEQPPKRNTRSSKQDEEEEEAEESFVPVLFNPPAVTSSGRTVKRKIIEECEPTITRKMRKLSPQGREQKKLEQLMFLKRQKAKEQKSILTKAVTKRHERENKILSKFHMPCIGYSEIPVLEPMGTFADSEKMDDEDEEEEEGLYDDEPESISLGELNARRESGAEPAEVKKEVEDTEYDEERIREAAFDALFDELEAEENGEDERSSPTQEEEAGETSTKEPARVKKKYNVNYKFVPPAKTTSGRQVKRRVFDDEVEKKKSSKKRGPKPRRRTASELEELRKEVLKAVDKEIPIEKERRTYNKRTDLTGDQEKAVLEREFSKFKADGSVVQYPPHQEEHMYISDRPMKKKYAPRRPRAGGYNYLDISELRCQICWKHIQDTLYCMKEHAREHAPDSLQCPYDGCNFVAQTRSRISYHTTNIHRKWAGPIDLTEHDQGNMDNLNLAIRRCFPIVKDRVNLQGTVCEICSSLVDQDYRALYEHAHTHLPNRPFYCSKCDADGYFEDQIQQTHIKSGCTGDVLSKMDAALTNLLNKTFENAFPHLVHLLNEPPPPSTARPAPREERLPDFSQPENEEEEEQDVKDVLVKTETTRCFISPRLGAPKEMVFRRVPNVPPGWETGAPIFKKPVPFNSLPPPQPHLLKIRCPTVGDHDYI